MLLLLGAGEGAVVGVGNELVLLAHKVDLVPPFTSNKIFESSGLAVS